MERWKYFLKNSKNDTLALVVAIDEIRTFLEPVFDMRMNGKRCGILQTISGE